MIKRLSKVCPGDHSHEPLLGGKAAAAAFYPVPLIVAILRGVRDTADAEDREEAEYSIAARKAMASAGSLHDIDYDLVCALEAETTMAQLAETKLTFRYANGTTVKLPLRFKDKYTDEYTGETLPQAEICRAIVDECKYFCDMVWEGCPRPKPTQTRMAR